MQQIKQDLATIEEKVANLAVELRALYGRYLKLLGHSARKQLILASYQICTQVYPESFLKLSGSDRQKLQENLRRLGKNLQFQLLALLDLPIHSSDPSDVATLEAEELLLPPSEEASSPAETEIQAQEPESEKIANPEDLIRWCQQIEQGIQETLETLSQEVNFYLQEAQILPAQVPVKVLEMAMQTEASAASASGSPNLLSLLIETEREGERESPAPKENAKITKLTAIHLRLAEIEFSDPTLNIERDRVRTWLEKLKKIRQQYRQLQREYAIAEAEAAWRATWYED
ncbi:hypothetical protein Ple7327_4164 [Pleurocapsa sp. PCC 7327]|uniref:hypothetical protein n=1 Tax=Pleurocapsa sp. PCC 7327 TaxID=118163 RepID=UPI00029FFAF0|nr:hypothetical protein [Pleurocapsa sp. PCC 7327]AFY79295.1 hypothetical protein Ple7327_4164 [Pleurocapsa sp. PCC 7327]